MNNIGERDEIFFAIFGVLFSTSPGFPPARPMAHDHPGMEATGAVVVSWSLVPASPAMTMRRFHFLSHLHHRSRVQAGPFCCSLRHYVFANPTEPAQRQSRFSSTRASQSSRVGGRRHVHVSDNAYGGRRRGVGIGKGTDEVLG